MRVICPHCDSKSTIVSSNRMSNTVSELYCQCQNARECGATFVFSLAFKHDLSPPQKTTLQILTTLLNTLTAEQRQRLKAEFSD